MFNKLLRRTVNLDEELNALRSKVKLLAAIESDNSTLVENEEIRPRKKRKREFDLWCRHVQDKRIAHKHIEIEVKEKGPSNNIKNRMEILVKEVDELIEQGKFLKGVVLDDHLSIRLPLVTTELVGKICSENITLILSWLKQDDALAIGIHGMGGVGKTTLMRFIHNKLVEDFNLEIKVYWVTASHECSLRKLQIDIGKALCLGDLSQCDDERRKALIFQGFSHLGKFVLFLDDLWKHYPAEEIGIPCNLCGCKMILSTRSLDVCNRMNCHETIKILPLSRQDAMILFVETLGGAVPIELNSIAEKIVAECGGLPLALKTMGCCMRGINDVHEWKNALCELRSPIIRHDSMEDEVFRVLKFSYNNLKDKKTQHCFLSCVLFPEDKVCKDVLVRFWINVGLLDEVDSDQDKVNRGKAILNRLRKSGLLESGKMHDLIRDMAMIITQDSPRFMAKPGINLEKVPENEQWSEDLLMVSLADNNITEIPSYLAPMTMKLSVLLLPGNPLKVIPESFFMHMRSLRVLDLSNTVIERLPNSVSKMKNLTTLLLRFCGRLTYLPSLEELVKLRILDLSFTNIVMLPCSLSNLENLKELLLVDCKKLIYIPSLARLTNLRVLKLDNARQLQGAPRGVERLKKLEEITYCPWNVNDMSGFCRLSNSLSSIGCYRFWISPLGKLPVFKKFEGSWGLFNSYNKTVWINGAKFEENETVLVPITIVALRIEECEMKGRRRGLGDVFLSLNEATNLKIILIEKCRRLEYIMQSCILDSLYALEEINLEDLPDLKRLVQFGGRFFSNLRRIGINKCPKIKVVFPLPLTNHQHNLPHLKELIVSECEEVEAIFESNITAPIPILVLDIFALRDLPKLKIINKGLLISTYLVVENCPQLELLKSENFICDASSSTLASISCEHAKGWWESLYHNYPKVGSRFYTLYRQRYHSP